MYMKGRHKSGIQVAYVLSSAMCWKIVEIAEKEDCVWKGSGVPTTDQGIRVLGTPLGTQITWKLNCVNVSMSTNCC